MWRWWRWWRWMLVLFTAGSVRVLVKVFVASGLVHADDCQQG